MVGWKHCCWNLEAQKVGYPESLEKEVFDQNDCFPILFQCLVFSWKSWTLKLIPFSVLWFHCAISSLSAGRYFQLHKHIRLAAVPQKWLDFQASRTSYTWCTKQRLTYNVQLQYIFRIALSEIFQLSIYAQALSAHVKNKFSHPFHFVWVWDNFKSLMPTSV